MTYQRELDGLRALAAIAVLAFHTRLPGFGGGFLGVDLFFVLSGYLTTSLILHQIEGFSPGAFRRFLSRRLWRLWPLLITFCGAVALAMWLAGDRYPAAPLHGALFIGNTDRAVLGYASYSVHTWSLAAEMQFYILIGLLALLLRSARRLRYALLAGFVGVTLYRLGVASVADWREGFYSPFAHSSGLFLGGLVATLPPPRIRYPGMMVGVALVALAAVLSVAQFRTFGALMLWIGATELATVLLLLGLRTGQSGLAGRWLGFGPLVWLGQLSYGLYLWHYPVAVLLRDTLPPVPAFVVTFAVSLALAAASFRWLEQPMRNRGRGQRAPAPASARVRTPVHSAIA
ncbi:acyltransferase family protein [Vannielia litorea]|uniref:acyltransferase family protein n=1 Tax=Vannielia litorea TaxID=1217970 RepID=UPI001C969377|nr:acyltransferase [Vannielia litorea]MBY6046195.1 acyltransferase [Vannielia litorea]MBY6073608.1 acyltransferase [Vannielia litorea]